MELTRTPPLAKAWRGANSCTRTPTPGDIFFHDKVNSQFSLNFMCVKFCSGILYCLASVLPHTLTKETSSEVLEAGMTSGRVGCYNSLGIWEMANWGFPWHHKLFIFFVLHQEFLHSSLSNYRVIDLKLSIEIPYIVLRVILYLSWV